MNDSEEYLVQLGTLHIQAGSNVGPSNSSSASWSELQLAFVDFLIELYGEDDDARCQLQTIRTLASDGGLGARFQWRRRASELVVRVALVPPDSPGSLWRRVGDIRRRANALSTLFRYLKRGWEVDDDYGEEEEFVLALTAEDDLNMLELYAAVPSPPTPSFVRCRWQADDEVKQRLAEYDNPLGVKTPLYQYQVRSVAKMLRMETEPERLVDPTFLPMREAGRDGTYYLNLSTMDLQRHPGWYDLPRGGILCEQMGTGKTLMCLSLIIATAHQPCLPPSNTLDISPTYTARAEGNYPFQRYVELRELVDVPIDPELLVRPTLEDMCADILAKTDHSIKRSRWLHPALTGLIDRQCFYYETPTIDDCIREAKRRTLRASIKKVWLANTTLVVVPAILVSQWRAEIQKHIEEGALSVYVAGKEELPPIERLMTYDIVLMDLLRFGLEWNITKRRLDVEETVLLQARWKRIILDEGHVAGHKTSNAMTLARKLNVERRWIVSGTPTKHLQQGGETQIESMRLPQEDSTLKTRAWSKRDFEDAAHIGVMVGHFLAAEPFKSEDSFSQHITNHLRSKEGPRFGAVGLMRNIMSNLMVKHGPSVIDDEARLPPSTVSTHLLEFHPMQQITFNVLTALVASNVYTSGGTDQDYFLHARNAKSLNLVVQNLHLACFWYSAAAMLVRDTIARSKKHLDEHVQKKDPMPEMARRGLEKAIKYMESALATPGWDEWMSNGVSVPFDVPGNGFPYAVRTAWSDSMDTAPEMIDAHSLLLLRNLNTPGRSIDELNITGWDTRAHKSIMMESALKEMDRMGKQLERQEQAQRKSQAANQHEVLEAAAHGPSVATRHPAKKPAPKKRKGNSDDPIDLSLEEAANNAYQSTALDSPGRDTRPRPLPAMVETKSRSAKVNFVLSSIFTSAPTDKFVIAGDKYQLGILDDALEVFDISVCYVGAAISNVERMDALRRFENPDVKVCLLDLSLAARGLNLVCANRMIFLAPVWSLDVQAQAIKRVHRIGQTRPTKVDILVTKGTFEEDIAQRSSKSRSADEELRYSRGLIENPRFVLTSSDEGPLFRLPFTPIQTSLAKALQVRAPQREQPPPQEQPSHHARTPDTPDSSPLPRAVSPITPEDFTLLTPTSAPTSFPPAFPPASSSGQPSNNGMGRSALKRSLGDDGSITSKVRKAARVVFECF